MTDREKLLAMAEKFLTENPCCSCCGSDCAYEELVVEALALAGLKVVFRSVFEDRPAPQSRNPPRKKRPKGPVTEKELEAVMEKAATEKVCVGRRGFLL